jgi:hypothetical protein
MTATNHAMTGAVIALIVRQPALAIPLAFASHFLLDAIPHFGIYENDVIRRNKHWLFRTVVSVDIPLFIVLLIVIPQLAASKLAWWIVFSSMVAAVLPDVIWVYRFINEVRTKQWKPGGWYPRFHQKIQWFERPTGLIVEIGWLGLMSLIFVKLVA